MNKQIIGLGVVAVIVIVLLGNPFYVVQEGEQAIITQFGRPVGDAQTEAGLKIKLPFIQKVNYFEKRILEWDGYSDEIPTKDKRFIWIDVTARWRISDPLIFFQSVNNEQIAHSLLDGIIDAAVRDVVAANNLIEIIRSSNRVVDAFNTLKEKKEFIDKSALERIQVGREKIREAILVSAKEAMPKYGIELIDVRMKRINYIENVRRKVYERMIAERKRAAEQFRSEGRGTRAEVEGKTEKELKGILSDAYKKAQKIKGQADATATQVYAEAYNKDKAFFSFLKSIEAYRETMDAETTLILTTDSDYFKYLKKLTP